MTQTAVLFLLLLFFLNSGVMAQPSGSSPFPGKSAGDSVAEIQGCLQRNQGSYILVDRNNEYEQLSNNKDLKKLVGHEVKLTGTPEIRTIDNTPAGGASSAIEQHFFRVKTAQDVAPTCRDNSR